MAGAGNKLDFGFGVFPYSYVSFADAHELADKLEQFAREAMPAFR